MFFLDLCILPPIGRVSIWASVTLPSSANIEKQTHGEKHTHAHESHAYIIETRAPVTDDRSNMLHLQTPKTEREELWSSQS